MSRGNDAAHALAAELRALRARSGKSLRELQRPTLASDSSLSRYLAGQTVPPWPVVEALCQEAGHDPDALRPLWQDARAARTRSNNAAADAPVVSRDADGTPPRARDGRVWWLLAGAAIAWTAGTVVRRSRSAH